MAVVHPNDDRAPQDEANEAAWGELKDRFDDATRATEGYARAVSFSYYDRLSVARMN